MEDNTGFQNGYVHELGADLRGLDNTASCFSITRGCLFRMPLDEPDAEILNHERQENAGHENCRCSRLVLEFSKTLVLEHEDRMCEELSAVSTNHMADGFPPYMDEGSRDDDASTKLAENSKDNMMR